MDATFYSSSQLVLRAVEGVAIELDLPMKCRSMEGSRNQRLMAFTDEMFALGRTELPNQVLIYDPDQPIWMFSCATRGVLQSRRPRVTPFRCVRLMHDLLGDSRDTVWSLNLSIDGGALREQVNRLRHLLERRGGEAHFACITANAVLLLAGKIHLDEYAYNAKELRVGQISDRHDLEKRLPRLRRLVYKLARGG